MEQTNELDRTFVVHYPMWLVAKNGQMTVIEARDAYGQCAGVGLCVFTDRQAAEEWRAQRPAYADRTISEVRNEPHFAEILATLRGRIDLVAFNPSGDGDRLQYIEYDEIVEQVRRGMERYFGQGEPRG